MGRINGIFIGTWFALIGGALQAATQSLDVILVARVVTGIGTGGKAHHLTRSIDRSEQRSPRQWPLEASQA